MRRLDLHSRLAEHQGIVSGERHIIVDQQHPIGRVFGLGSQPVQPLDQFADLQRRLQRGLSAQPHRLQAGLEAAALGDENDGYRRLPGLSTLQPGREGGGSGLTLRPAHDRQRPLFLHGGGQGLQIMQQPGVIAEMFQRFIEMDDILDAGFGIQVYQPAFRLPGPLRQGLDATPEPVAFHGRRQAAQVQPLLQLIFHRPGRLPQCRITEGGRTAGQAVQLEHQRPGGRLVPAFPAQLLPQGVEPGQALGQRLLITLAQGLQLCLDIGVCGVIGHGRFRPEVSVSLR